MAQYNQQQNNDLISNTIITGNNLEDLLDAIAIALIQSPLINTSDVENNQKFIRNGQLQIGQGEGVLALFQKDIKANKEDINTYGGEGQSTLENYANQITDFNSLNIDIQEGIDNSVSIFINAIGLPPEGYNITELVVGEGNPLNVSQFLPIQKTKSVIDDEKAEEFLDTNIFELLPSGDTRQARIIRFFQELNALLPPTLPDFNNPVERDENFNWVGTEQYSQDNSITFNSEDGFIQRIKNLPADDINFSRTIEDIYNTVLPYLTDILEGEATSDDGRPEYENQSSGYLKFRNLNQGIIIRNTNQDFVEGLDPNNLTYLNKLDENGEIITTGTGFTITMWVRFLDKVSEGTLFNFGNPTRDENPFGFKLETFVLDKDDETFYPPQYDSEGKFTTWGSTVENINDLNNQGIFSNSNTARFVRLQVREEGNLAVGVRDSHIGNPIRKISWSYPDFRYRDGIEASMNLRLINSTFIPEDFNEWYFICASYSPGIIEPRKYSNGTNDIEPEMYETYQNNKEFWMNHRDPFTNALVPNSGYGNKCKVEIISRTDLLRARGFKV